MFNWKNCFNEATLKHGKILYNNARVKNFKEHELFCIATVDDGTPYIVTIQNPDKENILTSCSCSNSKHGAFCEHIAAVLYKWQEIQDVKERERAIKEEIEGLRRIKEKAKPQIPHSPFANHEEHKPFFDFEIITENFYFSKDTIRAAYKLIENGEVHLESFNVVYDKYSSGIPHNDKCFGSITGHGIQGNYNSYMEILIDRNTIRRYSCDTCRDYYYGWSSYGKLKPCIHLTALLILANDYVKKFDPGDFTDYNAINFLDAFRKETSRKISHKNPDLTSVQLEPKIIETVTGMELNYKIGNGGKMYVVKNLTQLHDLYYGHNQLKLGKTGYIDFATEKFDEESEKLFAIVEREVKRSKAIEQKLENKYNYYATETYRTGKGVPLVGDAIDTLYELFYERTIECKFLDSRKSVKLKVTKKDPVIMLNINPEYYNPANDIQNISENNNNITLKNNTGKKLSGIFVSGNIPFVIDGVKNRYYIDDNVLSVLDNNLYSKIHPFMSASDYFGDVFEFFVGEKHAAEFYYKVLPELMTDPVFRITENDQIASLIHDKAEFSFYIDAAEGNILCKTSVTYGEDTFPVKSMEAEDFPLNERRDLQQEMPVIELMQNLFEFFDPDENAFVTEDSNDARYEFLKHGINYLFEYGEVHSTDNFSKIKIRSLPVVQMGVSLKNNLLDLTVQNQDMTSEELVELLKSYKLKKKYHKLRNGEYVDLEKNDSINVLMHLLETSGVSLKDFVRGKLELPAYRALYLEKMLEGHDELVADRKRTYRNLIRNFKTIEDGDFDVPRFLQNILRPYQSYGFKWLKTLESAGFGGILADDMGLGKTLQIISLLLSYKETASFNAESIKSDTYEKDVLLSDTESTAKGKLHSLVVCPASLVYNWIEEIERFAPELKAVAVTGTKKQRKEILADSEDYDILATSYDLLKRDIDLYDDLQFSHQIIDEAQFIKNAGSAAAKSVKLIHASHRFALTGTPIENRLSELWSIFDYVMPGFLFRYENFRKTFELPISKYKDEQQTEALKNIISPFLLRRKKNDVLKDLPDKIEEIHYAKFDSRQQKLYDAQVNKIRKVIQSEDADFDKNKIIILAELTKLRQICCDPELLFENYQSGSAKRDACIDLIKSAIDGEHRILLFSQFTSMLELLENDLKHEGIDFYKLTGATSKEDRMKMVKDFNTNNVPVFLISLKAGGTGLNLTGADIVVHYDPWWNQAAQDQATDRAHRIGQTKNVTVYQIIAKNTIEERIVSLQTKKKELADAILAGENRSIGSMSKDELLELLSF